uniref:Uncharacterized protein n=1 Tax=Vespula pensylvanica TaxID=30213 RepID=A0A834U7D1_VESPE|nr:hypothetical protein H0235_010110 [Vespula pensylvanica]
MSLRHVEREDASGLTQTCPLPPEIRRAAHVAAVLGSSDNGLINFTLISLLINGDLVILRSKVLNEQFNSGFFCERSVCFVNGSIRVRNFLAMNEKRRNEDE